jgi:hypothetical protein
LIVIAHKPNVHFVGTKKSRSRDIHGIENLAWSNRRKLQLSGYNEKANPREIRYLSEYPVVLSVHCTADRTAMGLGNQTPFLDYILNLQIIDIFLLT